ncbi:MAG: DUF418 domain-containing protein [Dermatophilus congolensis]|nr:DUF418 domain-containing protein [Dermatophilus congolensis]
MSRTSRLPALDVLRGIAILGTLLTNIWIFTAVTGAGPVAQGDGAGGADTGWQQMVGTALDLVTDGKWIGLLTIMFGIGMEIQRQSALRRGESWLGTYPWRAGLLVVEGLLNYIFVFEFDVLMGYGLTALAVCVVLATSPRAQKIWLAIGLTAHLAVLTVLSVPSLLATVIGEEMVNGLSADGTATSGFEAAMDELAGLRAGSLSGTALDAIAARHHLSPLEASLLRQGYDMLDTGTQSYWAMVGSRIDSFWLGGRFEIPIMFTMGLGLFLVGAFLYRAGLFEPAGRRLRFWVMGLAFGVGLPIDVTARLFFSEVAGAFPRYLTSTFVAFGVLASVAHWYANGRAPGLFARGLANVGKMALTCYIAQNAIASLIFYDFGLGVARQLPTGWEQPATLAIYAGIATLLIVFSTLWLQVIPRGPAEWLMHTAHAWILAHVHRPLATRRQVKVAHREAGSVQRT